ncbi:MAG: M67 family metallopeptidase [Nitrospirota bacterium]|nr:M67 family metallopeptidase [Nitrospirota bacterium]
MKLTRDTIEKIYGHAMKEYPRECCGIVTGNGDRQTVHMCENIQDRMHAEDPAAYPRDARTAYFIERREFDRIISSAKSRGEHILAFYHSHPEHEAYFSEEDVAAQTVFGEPEFPDALHAVVSVMNGGIHDMKCFEWLGAANNFFMSEDCG